MGNSLMSTGNATSIFVNALRLRYRRLARRSDRLRSLFPNLAEVVALTNLAKVMALTNLAEVVALTNLAKVMAVTNLAEVVALRNLAEVVALTNLAEAWPFACLLR